MWYYHFLSFNPSAYSAKLSSPFHNPVLISCPIAPLPPRHLPNQRRCRYYASAKWEDIRQYYTDFPWNDNCFRVRDPSLCAERIREVIISGISVMEANIPHSFLTLKFINFGLTLFVLVISLIERRLTKRTLAIPPLKRTPVIFLPDIIPNLFFD